MRARIVLLILVAVGLSPSVQAQSIADVIRWQATKDAPEQPITPVPASGAVGVSLTPTLTWTSAGATSGYDVYLGVSTTPAKVATVSTPSYTSVALTANTKYYWKIVAKNPKGTMAGVIWTFTTMGGLPPPPPPPPPPPVGTPSADGTHVPPATQIIDAALHVWTLGAKNAAGFFAILRDGVQVNGNSEGRAIAKCSDGIWTDGDDATDVWYPWTGTTYDFTRTRTTDPCPPVVALKGVAWDPESASGFVVVYGTASQVYTTVADVGNVTAYQLPNLVMGTRYFIAVQAYSVQPDGSKVFSALSPEVSGVP